MASSISTAQILLKGTDVPKLINIIDKDMHLLKNWEDFCDLLAASNSDKLSWRRGINSGNMTYSGVFKEILVGWIANDRTVENLAELLDAAGYKMTASMYI